ncbi:MAG: type I DNA topoisomerase [Candidatus Aminicenantes bacterium]|nr:type I DNA topoisomerase [Candidatus Aminicenantes bacterium]
MAKHLVIVESPAKARTVNRYLGSDYLVSASMGHVRDLPKSKLGVDVEHDFTPEYKIIPERKELVSQLRKAAERCDGVYLAADPDREGEAICWHLSELLEGYNDKVFRVLFYEITKKGIEEAFKKIGELDSDKIMAQQTRRILDRLVGYRISPLLWKKIGRGLSAGRVQSIVLRLICEREKEIKDFVPEEFWTITALLQGSNPPEFRAQLVKISGHKAKIKDGKSAEKIADEVKRQTFILKNVAVKEKKRWPNPPYITSSLQQDCFRLLRFPVKKTMSIAQRLYEGLEIGSKGLVGLITYMRSDSVRISEAALRESREYIAANFGKDYLPSKAKHYKNKKKAQDAHEAIRPTSFDVPPDALKSFLKEEEYKLYSLIWNRFIASQMNPALVEETEFDIRASEFQFKAKGEVIKFDGYLVLYPKQAKEQNILPKVQPGEELDLLDLETKQNFTQPPPRYTEGSLVKELEARGIGRPSTYAPIITTIQGRDYAIKEKGRFIPTELGLFVNDYLIEKFPDLMEFKFTARLEEELDRISEGESDWLAYLSSYNSLLDKDLDEAMKDEGIKAKGGIPLEDVCPECGKKLVLKEGRFGRFKACTGYPDCQYKQSMAKKEAKPLEEKCPQCGSQLVMRHGRYGAFAACSNYPECKYIKKESRDTGISCPSGCGGTLLKKKTKKGKFFYGCSHYPKCKYATWDEPVKQPCPLCKRPFVLKKISAKEKAYLHCSDENCPYREDVDETLGENTE